MNVLRYSLIRNFKLASRIMDSQNFSTSTKANPAVAAVLKLGRLNHVAIATPNLKQATAMYRYICKL